MIPAMNKKVILSFVLLVSVAVSCMLTAPERTNLYLYTWSDYFDPELIARFEKENGCKVVIDTFDSNESAFAKLSAGATGYDLITPTSYFIPTMRNKGLLAEWSMDLLPNVARNFDRRFSKLLVSDRMAHSVPYALSLTGVMYRRDSVPDGFDVEALGWSSVTNPVFKGRSSIFNDPREVIGCALRTAGFSANSTNAQELSKALAVAKGWKRGILKMDNEMYKSAVASSELLVAMGYNSDAMQIMQDDDGVSFAIPREGTTASFDEFCLSATAVHTNLAHAFVDFMYDPTNAARNVEYIYSIMPVKGIEEIVDPGLKNRGMVFPSDEILSRCELLKVLPPDALKAYTAFWDELKGAK